VAFRQQITSPEKHKFPTPSGKIEIYCERIAAYNRPAELPPVPQYVAGWEDAEAGLSSEYPLQLITTHSRKRIHSQLHTSQWHRNMEPHAVWINPVDAAARNISDGDTVEVFNRRGTVRIVGRVTERIMPGVVSIYEGAWYEPDTSGVDRGGCANTLTRDEHSPGGAFCSNTTLVQVVNR